MKATYRRMYVELAHEVGQSAAIVYDYILDSCRYNRDQDYKSAMREGIWAMRTSHAILSERCAVSTRTARRAVATLIEKGYIRAFSETCKHTYYAAHPKAVEGVPVTPESKIRFEVPKTPNYATNYGQNDHSLADQNYGQNVTQTMVKMATNYGQNVQGCNDSIVLNNPDTNLKKLEPLARDAHTRTHEGPKPKDEFFALALEDEKPNQEQTRPEPDETPPLDNPAPDNDILSLVSLFYQRAIEYGWRKSAPHPKDQVADVGILQKYRDDEYTYSAIRTMIEWHAARHKETGDPIRSFAFFDPDRYPHKTPMQVALETSWAKVEAEKKAEREAPVVSTLSQAEGMALFRAALVAIAPKPFPDAKPDNRRKLQEQSDELAERRRKQWLLSLDPGDTSIPDVSELRRTQESEWMDREIQEAAL